MRHIDDRHAEILVDMLDFILHLLPQLLVERAERLVHQHQIRFEHQRPRDGDALLLATRQLRRAAGAELRQFHHLEGPLDLFLLFGT